MQKISTIRTAEPLRLLYLFLASLLVFASLNIVLQPKVSAGALTARKLALSTSAGNTSATWTLTFTTAVGTALNGIAVQVCTTASGACTAPNSWSNSGSAFGSLTYNGSSQGSWTLDNAAGYLRAKNNASATAVTSPVVLTFNTVTNPDTTNETFFGRITTYSGDDFTSAVDTGVVAAATSQQISLSGTMSENLTFCTGTSITGTDCGTVSGSSINFGAFSSSSTSSGTSVMAASTNADSGYSITVNGATLTASGETISALASQTASSTGTEQFGLNLKDNATPNVGAEVSGAGSGAATANYGTADQYRFVTGDSVASAAANTNANAFTVSYIVNVGGATEPGTYTATMTYICTATF